MTDSADTTPAQAVGSDADADKAPNPRRHYASPEDLREDIDLDIGTRVELLREWQSDLDQRLSAEAEGMSASDPMSADKESRLANEHRRVSRALEDIAAERQSSPG